MPHNGSGVKAVVRSMIRACNLVHTPRFLPLTGKRTGLRFRSIARRGRVHLPMRGDEGHCRYSSDADTHNADNLRELVHPPNEAMSGLRSHLMLGIPCVSNKG